MYGKIHAYTFCHAGILQNFMKKPAQIATITKTGMGCRDTKFSKICREEEHLITVRKLRKQLNGL